MERWIYICTVGARESSVIDYVFVNGNVYDKMMEFKIEVRVDLDHMLLIIEMDKQKDRST